jgi:elongator complex protein 3
MQMLFAGIKTEEDIEKLKKRIVKDPVYSLRLKKVQERMQYPVDGVLHPDGKSVTMPSKAEMLALYKELVAEGIEEVNPSAEMSLRKIKTKSNSGVAVVSLLTKPFACPGRCTYCPTDVSMPKSYLAKEPAAARALMNDFDPYMQITNRIKALEMNGHPVDKIEMIVIGGTWSFYHPNYQEEFLIGCYRACNDYITAADSRRLDADQRRPDSVDSRTEAYTDRLEYLQILQDRNEKAQCRIIGLSIETRPDYITDFEIERLRIFGVTKVEIGVQHLDDSVFKMTKRDMKIERVKQATEKLRNAGFKMVYHMMPNLPGSTPERDISMFGELFSGEDFQPDMLKIYPCMVLEHSELYDTWNAGGFKTYSDEQLIEVMREEKKQVPPYVRILRVYRDIPASYIKAGSTVSNLRQVMDVDMEKNGWQCRCIRCREIREGEVNPEEFVLSNITYRTKTGTEHFLSFESPPKLSRLSLDKKGRLASFTRLRLPDNGGADAILPVLKGAALIRELHTYGRHMKVGGDGSQSQHVGFGRRLLAEAERIAKEAGYEKMAIISGIGVREYYRKLGYALEGTYMLKKLTD